MHNNLYIKLNEIVHKFFLAGDKFMPEMYLKQPGFTYSVCRQFTINKETIQKFKETGDTKYIYENERDKACFQHDMAYGEFTDLAGRTAFVKVLRDKAFNITKNAKFDGYQRGLASMVHKLFDKKSKGKGVNIPSVFNKLLAEELHKQIIRNFKKKNSLCRFKDNILGADLVDMQLIKKFNKGFRVL